ncbi:MAG: hypothetical protein LUQ31_00210 [Methanoregula sp.]|nr:hypothetical protein [Methanoregula sp.]
MFPAKKKNARKNFAAGRLPLKIFRDQNVRSQNFFEPGFLPADFFRTRKKAARNFSLQRTIPVILAHVSERQSGFTTKTSDPGHDRCCLKSFCAGIFGPEIFFAEKMLPLKIFRDQNVRPKKFFEPEFLLPEFFRSEKKVRENFWARARMVRSAVRKKSKTLMLRRFTSPFRALFSRFA